MLGDGDDQQATGSVAGKKSTAKNRARRRSRKRGDASRSRPPPAVVRTEDVTERVGQMSISAAVPAALEPGPSVGQGPVRPALASEKPIPEKKKPKLDSPVFDLKDAFDREDAKDAEDPKKLKRRARPGAEDAFAELEKITGIRFDQMDKSALCLRPKFASGTIGTPTRLLTNFFKLTLKGNTVYQYDIDFLKADNSAAVKKEQEVGRKFKRMTKRVSQSLLREFVTTTGSDLFREMAYAYDNDRILITNKPLGSISNEGQIFSFQFTDNENSEQGSETIHIQIKHTASVALAFERNVSSSESIGKNRTVLQLLDIIAKKHAFQYDIIYGSKIFLSAQNSPRSAMGSTPYELAFGYHQSTLLCEGGVMQNIDRATAVLYKGGPLTETIAKLLGIRLDRNTTLGPRDHEVLKELTFLRIETDYRGYTSSHTLRSFTNQPCNGKYFIDTDGTKKSVADYFREHYKIDLKYPGLPCVENSPGKFIPIELCKLKPDQRNQRKLREELIRIVSKQTTSQKPFERARAISDVARSISGQLNNNGFKIDLFPSQVEVKSRILAPPTLKYGDKPTYAPHDPGSWDMREKKLFHAKPLLRWACFTLISRKINGQVAGRFVDGLRRNGNSIGIQIENTCLPHKILRPDQLAETFESCLAMNLQLIVFMMPEDAGLYSMVKSLGDQKLGVPTQVVLDKHFDPYKRDRQKLFDTAYQCNLLLKINMKIGGTNLKLSDNCMKSSILNAKTMVVGIDVNHPSPGEQSPSIAAVVGSIDEDFSQYRTEIRINNSRDEIVQVDQMIGPILDAFKRKRGYHPEHIIVYRDGVSEGQFAKVMGDEILPLHKKLETLPTKPKLTYIIVQKRHKVRFFPTERNMATRSGNILPGSVIDTDVCHYKWFDFYLCSQNSFLGTARPGKYTVLWHSSPANADQLQTATYYLCYLFARATKSIADPAPARYAHHAAGRGKVHINEILRRQQRLNDQDIDLELNNAINVTEHLKQILYFI